VKLIKFLSDVVHSWDLVHMREAVASRTIVHKSFVCFSLFEKKSSRVTGVINTCYRETKRCVTSGNIAPESLAGLDWNMRTIDLWYPIHVYEIGQAVKFTTSVLLFYIDRGLII
jgi:hypothetical protein